MSKDGTLANLYVQMREQAAVDKLLEGAQFEEVDLQSATPEEAKSDASELPEPKAEEASDEGDDKAEKKPRSTKKSADE
jgi:hypothetical protein